MFGHVGADGDWLYRLDAASGLADARRLTQQPRGITFRTEQ